MSILNFTLYFHYVKKQKQASTPAERTTKKPACLQAHDSEQCHYATVQTIFHCKMLDEYFLYAYLSI